MTASWSGWPGASRSARAESVGLDVLEVEGDAVVVGGDRAVTCWSRTLRGNVGDLVAALLSRLAMRPPSRVNAALKASSM